MEHWREMAGAVPWTLLTVAIDTSGLIGTLGSALRLLGAVDQTLSLRGEGADPGDLLDARAGRFGAAALEGALRELARIDALRAGARYAYNLYVTRSALPGAAGDDDEREALRQLHGAWERHGRDAFFRAGEARRNLRAAAANARAAEDAFRVLRSFRLGSPHRRAWRLAALRLAGHAAVSAVMTRRALGRMRGAVALEFYEAWRTVNR